MIMIVLRAFLFSAGILLLNIIFIHYSELAEKLRLVDALFLEGAILMVLGGMGDAFQSLTIANIRRLLNGSDSYSFPIRHERSSLAAVMLLTGIFLMIHAFFMVFLMLTPSLS